MVPLEHIRALVSAGKLAEAIGHLQPLVRAAVPNSVAASLYSEALSGMVDIPNEPTFIGDIERILATAEIDIGGASRAATIVLQGQFQALARAGLTPSAGLLGKLAATPHGAAFERLLVRSLIAFRNTSLQLEASLTALRRQILLKERDNHSDAGVDVMAALAIQCFINDYVFSETPEEEAVVGHLAKSLETDLAAGRIPTPLHVACLAAYRPLASLEHVDVLSGRDQGSKIYGELLRIQVDELLTERAIRPTLEVLRFDDATSRNVQAQYEENPYPHWTRLGIVPVKQPADQAPQQVLIAGAGTGRHPIKHAMRAPRDHIVALDLSRASLARAVRKAREFGATNIRFVHGDILDVAALGLTFDWISSVGVIHHMADPTAGLRSLAGVLKRGGRIEIGIYTESGRKDVVAGIALRDAAGLAATPHDIRMFRQEVIALPDDHPAKRLTQHQDFYSLAEVRDLVFNVVEHRFTFGRAKAMIADAGLRVTYVAAAPWVREEFRRRFSAADSECDLDAWATVDESVPDAFGSMYGFVLTKD